MKKLLLLFLLFSNSAFSQSYSPEWAVRFNAGESSFDFPTNMAVDSAGNVFVTGKSWGDGTDYDYSTVKYNSAGVFQWEARYNGPGNYIDEPTGIAVDKSGNVFVTGNSYGGSSDYDFATIKYNSNGVQQWVDRYNGILDSTDKVNSIVIDNSGNIYVSGHSFKFSTIYKNEIITIKYNSSGNRLWIKSYNYLPNSSDIALAIKLDVLGNVYVGERSSPGTGGFSDQIIKYNSLGILQWVTDVKTILENFEVDGLGNSYVSICRSNTNSYTYRIVYKKYNSAGLLQWDLFVERQGEIFSGKQYQYLDNFGNCYMLISTLNRIYSYSNPQLSIFKFNSLGSLQWEQTYNGSGNLDDYLSSLTVDLSGNVYVAGYSSYPSSGNDFATIKYNSSGIKQWVSRYTGGPYADEPSAIGVDYSGNVYVTGSSVGYLTEYDYLTIKYPSSLQLNATVLIEGFYNQSVNRLNTKDTLTAYIRNTTFPYAIVDSGKAVIDSLNFLCGFCFNRANAGTYYISIKHRNSIETWSKAGGEVFSKSIPTYYNFTTTSSQAFGNNLKLKGTKYCVYNGDLNQDGVIDATDLSRVENDNTNSASGYSVSDVNGDFFVDATDISIVGNNKSIGVFAITP
jgi:hypothetical protein